MLNANQPMLLYDGDCPMCRGAVKLLERLGLARVISIRPWPQTDLPSEDLAERIRSEILLYVPDTREVLGGVPVLIRLIELHSRWSWLSSPLKWPPASRLLSVLYRMIALNRRILSPPPHRSLPCACDPPENPGARRQLYLTLLLFTLNGMAAFALAASSTGQLSESSGDIFQWIASALLLGWIPGWLAGLLLFPGRMRELIQQSLVVSAIGGIWFLGLSLIIWITRLEGLLNVSMALVGFLVAAAAMDYSLMRRLRTLGFPGWVHGVWLLSTLALSTPLWPD
jgi:predicted DCC family thiol-disulfide oxidoreductase YuxK